MADENVTDLDLVAGATIPAALARLRDAGAGYIEAAEFLVLAVARHHLVVDADERLQQSARLTEGD